MPSCRVYVTFFFGGSLVHCQQAALKDPAAAKNFRSVGNPGDSLYNPFIVVWGIVYYWVYVPHYIVVWGNDQNFMELTLMQFYWVIAAACLLEFLFDTVSVADNKLRGPAADFRRARLKAEANPKKPGI